MQTVFHSPALARLTLAGLALLAMPASLYAATGTAVPAQTSQTIPSAGNAAYPSAANGMATPGSAANAPAAIPASSSNASLPVQSYTPPNAAPPPPSNAAVAAPSVSTYSNTSNGINIPSPPPPSAFTNDPNQLQLQAEAAAQEAQNEVDVAARKAEAEHNAKSYDKAAAGLMPLSPDQVRDFMHKLEQTQNAAQTPYAGTPKGQTRVSTLSLDPGVEPPQVNLATGYVTTITMVDATGEPWPIMDVGVGGNFEVSPTASGTHVVRIMPLTRVGTGDLSVLLKDLPTPVIFRLSAGGPTVDLRYDARIGKLGPGAKPQIIARQKLEAGDETLTLVLENAPPSSATRVKIAGLDARTKAWSMGDKVYVRTPLTMLSPAWNASVSSADGTNVYEIGTAPVLLMSDNGAMVRAQISRDDEHDR